MGGVCPDNAAPGNAAGARCGGGGGEGGEAGEQQIRAPGNPYFSFSSSSFSLCIRHKKFRSRQCRTPCYEYNQLPNCIRAIQSCQLNTHILPSFLSTESTPLTNKFNVIVSF
jgi:hypothetical protein